MSDRFMYEGYFKHETGHLSAFDPLFQRSAIAWCLRKLRTEESLHDIDSIAFRGHSGASVAYPVSALTGIALTHVKKQEDTSHAPFKVVGMQRPAKYVIIDDFTETGSTILAITEQLGMSKCCGLLLYRGKADAPFSIDSRITLGDAGLKKSLIHYAEKEVSTEAPDTLVAEIALWTTAAVKNATKVSNQINLRIPL